MGVRLRRHWPDLRIGEPAVLRNGAAWSFSVPVDLGEIAPEEVAVQLYAEPLDGGAPFLGELCSAPSMFMFIPGQHRRTDRRTITQCGLFRAIPGQLFRPNSRSFCGRNDPRLFGELDAPFAVWRPRRQSACSTAIID